MGPPPEPSHPKQTGPCGPEIASERTGGILRVEAERGLDGASGDFNEGRTEMNDPNVFEITETEHHALQTCPCVRCVVERERRGLGRPANNPIRRIPVDVAHVLGFIPTRCPEGSLARRLMNEMS